jgi:hypothetical protein
MTDARLRELRRLLRQGELPEDLHQELRAAAARMTRLRLLPPSFSPYGVWNDEAAEEIFGGWYAERLLGRGHLQALLDRAGTAGAFRRLAERSLRQYLLNAQDRSQAHNLYRRVVELLDESERFIVVRRSAKAHDQWHGLDAAAPEWVGPDRELVAAAWALGDFTVIRYRPDAAKLSPVLDAAELERFVAGLMDRTGAALTPRLIMDALSARFDLGAVELVDIDDVQPPASVDRAGRDLALRESARFVVAELSARQRAVLQASADATVAEMAEALGCSVGTIINEQRRIGLLVARLSEDDAERDELLNMTRDTTYVEADE